MRVDQSRLVFLSKIVWPNAVEFYRYRTVIVNRDVHLGDFTVIHILLPLLPLLHILIHLCIPLLFKCLNALQSWNQWFRIFLIFLHHKVMLFLAYFNHLPFMFSLLKYRDVYLLLFFQFEPIFEIISPFHKFLKVLLFEILFDFFCLLQKNFNNL
jgi:hypothetical protein